MDEVADRIEHTVLGPTTAWGEVAEALDTALRHGLRACVPPCYVERACEYAPTVDVTTVVGFPHGQHTTELKCREAARGWKDGADELDLVANLGLLRGGDSEHFETELTEVIAAVPVPVKVIVEAHLLEEWELRAACEAAEAAGAAFLKTSTGFSDGGATAADVEVMSEYLPVKASGGIGSWATASDMFDAGAERIGTSRGDTIIREYRAEN